MIVSEDITVCDWGDTFIRMYIHTHTHTHMLCRILCSLAIRQMSWWKIGVAGYSKPLTKLTPVPPMVYSTTLKCETGAKMLKEV